MTSSPADGLSFWQTSGTKAKLLMFDPSFRITRVFAVLTMLLLCRCGKSGEVALSPGRPRKPAGGKRKEVFRAPAARHA